MRTRIVSFGIVVGFSLASVAHAEQRERRKWGVELRLQAGTGGDEIASVMYSDGSTSDLKAGRSDITTFGVIYSPWASGAHALDTTLLLGYGSASTGPENTDDRLRLGRWIAETLIQYRYRPARSKLGVRAGGGAAYHLIGKLWGTGALDDVRIEVGSAPALVLEAVGDYYFAPSGVVGLGVRYTNQRLTIVGRELDAWSVGIVISGAIVPR